MDATALKTLATHAPPQHAEPRMTLLETQKQLAAQYDARHGHGAAEKLLAGDRRTLANIQKLTAGLGASTAPTAATVPTVAASVVHQPQHKPVPTAPGLAAIEAAHKMTFGAGHTTTLMRTGRTDADKETALLQDFMANGLTIPGRQFTGKLPEKIAYHSAREQQFAQAQIDDFFAIVGGDHTKLATKSSASTAARKFLASR